MYIVQRNGAFGTATVGQMRDMIAQNRTSSREIMFYGGSLLLLYSNKHDRLVSIASNRGAAVSGQMASSANAAEHVLFVSTKCPSFRKDAKLPLSLILESRWCCEKMYNDQIF